MSNLCLWYKILKDEGTTEHDMPRKQKDICLFECGGYNFRRFDKGPCKTYLSMRDIRKIIDDESCQKD